MVNTYWSSDLKVKNPQRYEIPNCSDSGVLGFRYWVLGVSLFEPRTKSQEQINKLTIHKQRKTKNEEQKTIHPKKMTIR